MLQVIIAGRATKDAELRWTANQTAVLGWTVAVDVGYGDKKHAVFVKCSLFGKRAEALDPYIKKGTSMTVIGEGDLNKWESDKGGGSEITCKAQEVTLQGRSKGQSAPESQQSVFRGAPAQSLPPQPGGFEDDDPSSIPF